MSDTIGRLTLVGTPIGNLSDFSPRAIEALENCDFIAAEDTRVTLKLLNHFGISKPLVSLSILWTIPGRSTPLMPESLSPQWKSRAFTRVPVSLPGAGWTTMPFGFSTTSRCSSSKTISRGISSG